MTNPVSFAEELAIAMNFEDNTEFFRPEERKIVEPQQEEGAGYFDFIRHWFKIPWQKIVWQQEGFWFLGPSKK